MSDTINIRSRTALQAYYVEGAVNDWIISGGKWSKQSLKGRGHAPRAFCRMPSTVRQAGGPVLEMRDMAGRPRFYTYAALAAAIEAAISRGAREWDAAQTAGNPVLVAA